MEEERLTQDDMREGWEENKKKGCCMIVIEWTKKRGGGAGGGYRHWKTDGMIHLFSGL